MVVSYQARIRAIAEGRIVIDPGKHFLPAAAIESHLWVCKCANKLTSSVDKLARVSAAPSGLYQLDGSFNCVYYCAFCDRPLKFFAHPQHDHVLMLSDAQAKHLLQILKTIYPEDDE